MFFSMPTSADRNRPTFWVRWKLWNSLAVRPTSRPNRPDVHLGAAERSDTALWAKEHHSLRVQKLRASPDRVPWLARQRLLGAQESGLVVHLHFAYDARKTHRRNISMASGAHHVASNRYTLAGLNRDPERLTAADAAHLSSIVS